MRPATLVFVAFLITASLSSSSSTASTIPPSTRLTSSSSSPASRLSEIFPAIATAVRDLSVVDSDDIGHFAVAKRNLRFMFSAMVSPLQLLDWSHWSPPAELISSSDSDDSMAAVQQQQYQRDGVAPAVDVLDEEADFALHGDPSHILRVAINAHNQRAIPQSPQHYVSSSSVLPTAEIVSQFAADTTTGRYEPTQPRMHSMQHIHAALTSTASPSTLQSSSVDHFGYNQMFDSSSSSSSYGPDPFMSSSYDPDPYASSSVPPIFPVEPSSSSSALPYIPLSSSSSSAVPPPSSGCDQYVHCGPGKPVDFTIYNRTLGRTCTRQLCVCPYDHTGTYCDLHYIYNCRPWLQADPHQQCMAVLDLPQATSYASHSERRGNTHIAASSSEFFTYEGILSGPPPPCVSLDGGVNELSFNFTCQFWADDTAETWGNYGLWNSTVTAGWTQNGSMPTFDYYVHNVDSETNRTLFAISEPYDPIRIAIRLHNTVHPSQYNSTTLTLTAPNLQYTNTTTGQAHPLSLPFHLPSLAYNFKRGGRVLLTVSFATDPWGLDGRSSGLPWQLTVEDGTWVLPGPTKRVSLTRWQTAGVVLFVVVVLLLLVWRWYQRRQTARMQELLAEQRGKQQSWFEHTD